MTDVFFFGRISITGESRETSEMYFITMKLKSLEHLESVSSSPFI